MYRSSSSPSISFVLPMFNESENIRDAVRTVRSLADDLTEDYEIVVVDDASTDGCGDMVRGMAAEDARIRFFRLEKNSKFGGAFAKGFTSAGKDVIIYMDSDLPVNVEDVKSSFPLIKDFDIVTGYSTVKKGETVRRKVISGVYNLLVQSLFGLNVRDINSGFKVVRRDIIDGIEFISNSPFIDVEIFLHARKKGGRVKQYPLVFRPREGGKSYIARLPIIWATFADMMRVWARELGRSG